MDPFPELFLGGGGGGYLFRGLLMCTQLHYITAADSLEVAPSAHNLKPVLLADSMQRMSEIPGTGWYDTNTDK